MTAFETAMTLMPSALKETLEAFPKAEEIRLRLGRPPGVVIAGRETAIDAEPVSGELLFRILEKATCASLYAAGTALREGYLSYRGIRIGVCGEAIYRDGVFSGLQNFSSLVLRLPADRLEGIQALIRKLPEAGTTDILIAAPPGVGKTTCLRELIRHASQSCRVCVIDERCELSGICMGQAQFDLGPQCDVLSGVSKDRAAMMLLRGMNPQIIAMDEITRDSDLVTVRNIAGCGVRLLASAHGANLKEMTSRSLYRELFAAGVFKMLITITLSHGCRIYSVEDLTA